MICDALQKSGMTLPHCEDATQNTTSMISLDEDRRSHSRLSILTGKMSYRKERFIRT